MTTKTTKTTTKPMTTAVKTTAVNTPVIKTPVRAGSANSPVGSDSALSETTTVWTVVQIPVAQIGPNPFQPRLSFEAEEMDDLVASVKAHGVLQPITVRTAAHLREGAIPSKPGGGKKEAARLPFELIAGERRLRACRAAGRRTVPAIVRDDLSDLQAAELAVVENVQRANLSVIEEARAYKRLMIEFRLKEERIAKKVGKSLQVVRDTLKLLALPEAVQQMLARRKLSASHGQLLLRLAPFEEVCTLVATHAEGSGMTAAALGQNLLPNARQLRDRKLVAELDYRTKFDWKNVCGQCPHKAYFAAGYASYCARPEEWQRKQTEAVELRKLEAARVLEEARVKEGAVDISILPSGSYRDLTFAQIPAGCSEGCACRSSASLPHEPTRPRQVCLEPERYDQLLKAHREAIAEERQRRYLGFYLEAKAVIASEAIALEAIAPEGTETVADGGSGSNEPMAQEAGADSRSFEIEATGIGLSLVVFTILCGDHLNYRGREKWDQLCREIADESQLDLPWERWQNGEAPVSEVLAVLRCVEAGQLVRFTANLLVAQEALQAIHYGGETPLLSAVLGHEQASQVELDEDEECGEEECGDEDCDEEAGAASESADGVADADARTVDGAANRIVEMASAEEDVDGTDFEGEEFEDERFHSHGHQADESRSFEDEPYHGLHQKAA